MGKRREGGEALRFYGANVEVTFAASTHHFITHIAMVNCPESLYRCAQEEPRLVLEKTQLSQRQVVQMALLG